MSSLPTRAFNKLGTSSAQQLSKAGVTRTQIITDEKMLTLVFLDDSGKELVRFFANRSTAQELAQFKPSKVREWASKVKTNAGKIALAKVKHFPMEATSFFVAIGALTVYDLIFNYHANPLAAEQFLESQKDPVSHVAFLAFMQANGLAIEPLMEMVEKPWLRKYLPYLGMSIGMAASQMVHGVGHSELLKACVLSNSQPNKAESNKTCDAAWSDFGTGWGPVLSEYGTGLATMFMSSIFAAASTWMATTITQKAIQWTGMQLLSFAIPGGGVSRIVRFAINTGNNLHFLAWDAYLRAPIENYIANAGSNKVIEKLSECLGAHLANQKRNRWSDNGSMASDERFTTRHFCDGNMVESTSKFFDLYRDWRSVNLKESVTAQQTWFQYLTAMTETYRTTQSFYQDLTDKFYKRNYKLADKTSSPLDQIVPLFGVAQTTEAEVDWTQYLDYPQDLVPEQIKVANFAAAQMLEDKRASDGMYGTLYPREKVFFDRIQESLASTDPKVIAKGLASIQRIFNRPAGQVPPSHEFLTSDSFKLGFKAIVGLIGQPDPKMIAGQGFFAAWNKVEGKEVSPFPNFYKNVQTPSTSEYLMAAAAFGPDATRGENLISAWGYSGFQAYFQPPRILRGTETQRISPASATIYENKIWIDSNPQACGSADRACYFPILDWMKSGHIRSDIMTAQGNNFGNWWNHYVEPQYLKAWKNFELKYEENVQQLAEKLFSKKNHYANATAVPNSPFLALDQERSVAILILNSIANSSAGLAPDEKIMNRKFNVLKDASNPSPPANSAMVAYQAEWSRVRQLFQQLRVPLKTAKDGNFYVSRLKESDLKSAQATLDERLKAVMAELQPKLQSENMKSMAKIANQSLQGSHQEILDYSMIINTASYVENNGTGITRRRCMENLATVTSSQNLFRGLDNNKDCQTNSDLVKSPN